MTFTDIRIRMLITVRPETLPGQSLPGTVLVEGREYKARAGDAGAVSGLCKNGRYLGVKPGEFEFIQAPDKLLKLHGICPRCFRAGLEPGWTAVGRT
jgi:hypothetical protein